MIGEFDLIDRFFRPLACVRQGSLGLRDDAAFLKVEAGRTPVLTVDTMVAGVHYLEDERPDLVAKRLLRVNLSDLAAMGARPESYLLAATLDAGIDEAWLEDFAAGLADDQQRYGIALLGGDTTSTPGPPTFSVTAVGSVVSGQAITRSGARIGDDVWVSGTIGDATLGLGVARGRFPELDARSAAALEDRYMLPRPRVWLGVALGASRLVHAAADVSDGLVADLEHVANASGVRAVLRMDSVPLSPFARAICAASPERVEEALTGGDDYELVFTSAPGARERILALGRSSGCEVHRIGHIEPGKGIVILDGFGNERSVQRSGFRHF